MLALALPVLLAAPQFTVPGDFDDLQEAIDAVPPGATIRVLGGTWPSITIPKPLTLVGDPPPRIEATPIGFVYEPCITLDGPGTGEVVLERIETGGAANGFVYSFVRPAIDGGGFSELVVEDSEITPPEWFLLTGLGYGASAIDVDVPLVWVERSLVRASRTAADLSPLPGPPPCPPGIRTPGTVVVLDALVEGGANGPFTHAMIACGGVCPGGSGGTGIVAAELFRANAEVRGGVGPIWFDPNGNPCCEGEPGLATEVASEVELANDLFAPERPRLGQPFTLRWSARDPLLALSLSLGVGPPRGSAATGWAFHDPASAVFLGLLESPGEASVRVPAATPLIGLLVAFQGVDLLGRFTRPVAGVLAP